jgi:hypothetical protein
MYSTRRRPVRAYTQFAAPIETHENRYEAAENRKHGKRLYNAGVSLPTPTNAHDPREQPVQMKTSSLLLSASLIREMDLVDREVVQALVLSTPSFSSLSLRSFSAAMET